MMIMCIIRKLGEDKKADWPSHLAEIVHAYNATKSAVIGYRLTQPSIPLWVGEMSTSKNIG